MTMRAKSISVKDVTEKTQAVAREVLADRMKQLGGKPEGISFFPDIGVIGLIIRDIDLNRVAAQDLVEVSEKIAGGVGNLAIEGKVACMIGRGGATMGYFPAIEDILLTERF